MRVSWVGSQGPKCLPTRVSLCGGPALTPERCPFLFPSWPSLSFRPQALTTQLVPAAIAIEPGVGRHLTPAGPLDLRS